MIQISITERAAAAVRESIDNESFRLRVSANKGGCSGWRWELETEAPESQQENDLIFLSNKIEIIVNKEMLHNVIGETIIDYTSANIVEQGFVFMRSNGQQCGCGESFTPVQEVCLP